MKGFCWLSYWCIRIGEDEGIFGNEIDKITWESTYRWIRRWQKSAHPKQLLQSCSSDLTYLRCWPNRLCLQASTFRRSRAYWCRWTPRWRTKRPWRRPGRLPTWPISCAGGRTTGRSKCRTLRRSPSHRDRWSLPLCISSRKQRRF